MELVFIRHGEAEHTLDLPNSLLTPDPTLTNEGIRQAHTLRTQFSLTEEDLIIISPIRRALETAMIWSDGIHSTKYVTPLVSPRIFPQKQDSKTLPCDELLTMERIRKEFPTFILDQDLSLNLWGNGINTLPENEFISLAKSFLTWCKQLNKQKIYIVSHDGTITSYRQYLLGENLSRDDFPKEIGWFILDY